MLARSKFDKATYEILTIILLSGSLLLRPTLLGQEMTMWGVMLVLLSLFSYILIRGNLPRLVNQRHILFTTVYVLIFWVYIMLHAFFLNVEHIDFAMKAALVHIFTIITCAFLLSNQFVNHLFFKYLIKVMSLMGYSCSITYLITLFIPIDNLFLFQYEIEGYKISGNIYFPFSILYGTYTLPDITFYRFQNIFREVGIAQAFLVWGLVYSSFFKMKKYIKVGLLLALILCFSTFSLITLLTTAFLWMAFRKFDLSKRSVVKTFLLIPGALVVLFLFYKMPYVGYEAKYNSKYHRVSVEERDENISQGLVALSDNIVGTGLYSKVKTQNAGINLLAASSQIGMLGFILVIVIFVSPFFTINHRNKNIFMISIFPIFITSLLAQPLLDAPLVYLMLFSNFNVRLKKNRMNGEQS